MAADYLKQLPITFKYKDDLVNAITTRIDNLLLEKCLKCSNFFSVGKDETPTVSCGNCGQGAHEPCYTDLGTTIAEYPGLKYYCSRCENSKKIENVNTLNSTPHNATVHDSSSAHSHLSPSRQLGDINNTLDEHARPVCEKYRRGVCPHGISGKTIRNGVTCEYGHPKRCQRFCQYSSNSTDGCNEGRDCELLHPILCKYGLKYQLCTNLRCKFTHIKGTKRYKPREQSSMIQSNDYERSYYDHNKNQPWSVQPTDQHPHPWVTTTAGHRPSDHSDHNNKNQPWSVQPPHPQSVNNQSNTTPGRFAQHNGQNQQQNERPDQNQSSMDFLVQIVQHLKEELQKDFLDFKQNLIAQIQVTNVNTSAPVANQSIASEQSPPTQWVPTAPAQSMQPQKWALPADQNINPLATSSQAQILEQQNCNQLQHHPPLHNITPAIYPSQRQ